MLEFGLITMFRAVVRLIPPLPVVARLLLPKGRLIVPLALTVKLLSKPSVAGPWNDTALNSAPAAPIVRPAVIPDATRLSTVRLSLALPRLIFKLFVGLVNCVYSNDLGSVLS